MPEKTFVAREYVRWQRLQVLALSCAAPDCCIHHYHFDGLELCSKIYDLFLLALIILAAGATTPQNANSRGGYSIRRCVTVFGQMIDYYGRPCDSLLD
jgi:hypothetical protein